MTGLVVDNFAGGGGASTGIEQALGRSVDIAVNHDPVALEMHRANHPSTLHLCEDVFAVHPAKVCAGRPVSLAWFSPDCKHFSKAKGGKPVDKRIRGLAWVAIRWAREVHPAVIVLENVEEFQTWGPLGSDDRPDPARRGLTFRRWVGNLRGLGYQVEWRELVAADYGAPTTRKRLFVIARCDGQRIVWPEPTHSRDGLLGLRPWRTAAECIDWTIQPAHRTRTLAASTRRRIEECSQRFGDTFLVKYYCTGCGQSVSEPLGTITTRDRFGLVHGGMLRMLQPHELFKAQGFPAEYQLIGTKTDQVRLCGNSVCPPVALAIVKANCAHASACAA